MIGKPTLYIWGIDPGLVNTGWGIVAVDGNRYVHVANGTIKTNSKDPLYMRLHYIDTQLEAVAQTHIQSYISNGMVEGAIEDVFVNVNPTSSLKLGMAQGVAITTLARMGISVSSYQNRVLKKALTGSGRADKTQIGYMVNILLGQVQADSEHSEDALAVALTHAHMRSNNIILDKSG